MNGEQTPFPQTGEGQEGGRANSLPPKGGGSGRGAGNPPPPGGGGGGGGGSAPSASCARSGSAHGIEDEACLLDPAWRRGHAQRRTRCAAPCPRLRRLPRACGIGRARALG